MKKLSIIIPAYNAEPYLNELLNCLDRQITDDVEVIVVDDGSKNVFHANYAWCNVIRQKNGGASVARNTGIENASGKYIAFIDADDLVSEVYIKTILEKIETENPDYIYLSWKTLPGGWVCDVKLKSIDDEFPAYNLCVWNRVYKKSLIGKTRFNVKKKIAEDAEFIRSVEVAGKKKAFVSDYMYFYRSVTPDSLTKRFAKGLLETERVVYYFKAVTSDMTYLIDEFKQTDKDAEVILLTERCDIPELKRYAMVMKPAYTKATQKRGEETSLIEVIKKPIKTQVVIWTHTTFAIGGIETFIYEFCQALRKSYDILVLYEQMDKKQTARLREIVDCRQIDYSQSVLCDTLLLNRVTDTIPKNITFSQSVQMVHGCYSSVNVPLGRDKIVCVSEVVKNFYGKQTRKAEVIHNFVGKKDDCLLLVSTTRLTFEKGGKRMVKLANLMNRQGVKFLWLCFTDDPIPEDAPENLMKIAPSLYAPLMIEKADYLVQLSDSEGFGYSIVEALRANTPVIVTPIPVLSEIGITDEENAYVVPFDFDDTFDTTKFLRRPVFAYMYENENIIQDWKKVLGNTKPKNEYDPERLVTITATTNYDDLMLKREVKKGESVKVPLKRAYQILDAGVAQIYG